MLTTINFIVKKVTILWLNWRRCINIERFHHLLPNGYNAVYSTDSAC